MNHVNSGAMLMPTIQATTYTKRAMAYFAAATISLYGLILLLPANKAVMSAYDLSAHKYKLLYVSIDIPLILIWLAAFYGYSRLQAYTAALGTAPEAAGFRRLVLGCQLLAFGLVIPTIVGLLVNSLANSHPAFHPANIIFNNYFALIFPTITFMVIAAAVKQLTHVAKIPTELKRTRSLLIIYTVLGLIFCYLSLRHLNVDSFSSSKNPYFIPAWLFMLTIILPYLYAWYVGLLAAYNLYLLGKTTPGILYRRALQALSAGLAVVIISFILTQYVRSVIPRVGHLSLNSALYATYVLYIIAIMGFGLLAYGSNQLKKIEEV